MLNHLLFQLALQSTFYKKSWIFAFYDKINLWRNLMNSHFLKSLNFSCFQYILSRWQQNSEIILIGRIDGFVHLAIAYKSFLLFPQSFCDCCHLNLRFQPKPMRQRVMGTKAKQYIFSTLYWLRMLQLIDFFPLQTENKVSSIITMLSDYLIWLFKKAWKKKLYKAK